MPRDSPDFFSVRIHTKHNFVDFGNIMFWNVTPQLYIMRKTQGFLFGEGPAKKNSIPTSL